MEPIQAPVEPVEPVAQVAEPVADARLTQQEVDKIVADRLARQEKSFEAKYNQKLKDIEQAEKLKNMSESERFKVELETTKQKLAEYEQEKLVSQFKVELSTKGLKADFAELIPVNDADKAKKAVDFLSGYKAEIEKGFADEIKSLKEQLLDLSKRAGAPTMPNKQNETPKQAPKMF